MSSFLGQSAALATAVLWSVTSLFFAYAASRFGSSAINRGRMLFALPLLCLTHWIIEGSFFPLDAEPFRWFWFALSSLLGIVLGDGALFYGFIYIGARLSMLIMATAPILAALGGWLFLGETLTSWEVVGTGLTLSGIAWVVTERQGDGVLPVDRRSFTLGLLGAFGGATGQAANLLTAKFGLVNDYSSLSATTIRIFVAAVVLWSIAIFQGTARDTLRAWSGDRQGFRALLGGTVAGPFLGIWASMVAIQLARVGIASTIMALPPVLLIPLEYLLFKRRASLRAIAGTGLAIGGVAIIFLLGSA